MVYVWITAYRDALEFTLLVLLHRIVEQIWIDLHEKLEGVVYHRVNRATKSPVPMSDHSDNPNNQVNSPIPM